MIVIKDDGQLAVENDDRTTSVFTAENGEVIISNIYRSVGLSMTARLTRADAVEVAKFILAHTAKE